MRRGFTLIELLVVIAIIAILAAILFPVFAKAREKARQASCLSNVKQISLGIMQYAQDYDEMLPIYAEAGPTVPWPSGSLGNPYWIVQIYPYVKNVQVFNCPSGDLVFTGAPTSTTRIGYSTVISGIALGTVVKPAETAMVGDTDGGGSYCFFQTYFNSPPSAPRYLCGRHNEGANIGFLDGHAKWVKMAKDSNGLWVHPTSAQGVYYRADGTS